MENYITDFLARLQKVTSHRGNQYQACCPAHDDKDPSLSIKISDDGKILAHCHAGCSAQQVVEAVGLSLKDLFPQHDLNPIQQMRRLEREYWAKKRKSSNKAKKPLPAFASTLTPFNREIRIHCGADAWEPSKLHLVGNLLLLPPGTDPREFTWPVSRFECLVIQYGHIDQTTLEILTLALFDHGASIVRILHSSLELSVIRRSVANA